MFWGIYGIIYPRYNKGECDSKEKKRGAMGVVRDRQAYNMYLKIVYEGKKSAHYLDLNG